MWRTTLSLNAARANLASEEAKYWTKLESSITELEAFRSSCIEKANPTLAAMNIATREPATSRWNLALQLCTPRLVEPTGTEPIDTEPDSLPEPKEPKFANSPGPDLTDLTTSDTEGFVF
ncbi:hypothetical protein N7490_008685 [Penicillium lividum]|nr:hypothetical protein N7490_008685 [Penicillium lividum]